MNRRLDMSKVKTIENSIIREIARQLTKEVENVIEICEEWWAEQENPQRSLEKIAKGAQGRVIDISIGLSGVTLGDNNELEELLKSLELLSNTTSIKERRDLAIIVKVAMAHNKKVQRLVKAIINGVRAKGILMHDARNMAILKVLED